MIIYFSLFLSFALGNPHNGMTFFNSTFEQTKSGTFLINNNYTKINYWKHEERAIGIPYLFRDGSIISQFINNNHYFHNAHGPIGGIFKKLSWGGDIIWDFTFYNNNINPHHDFVVMPNGNLLILSWEKKSLIEAQMKGRVNISDEIWSLAIFEINPVQNDSSNIVWEWHLWDHLIQDIDPELDDFGSINENPQRLNINIGDHFSSDWLHTNSIDYNSTLDQIIFSSRNLNEIYIIDHSTTTEEAIGSMGGNSGKGGDILFRWGNPYNYDRGQISDRVLGSQHGVNWIEDSFPGSGQIIIFNNNPSDTIGPTGLNGNSSVIQINPCLDSNGNYMIETNSPFLLYEQKLIDGGDHSFFSNFQSGAYRLENGNTLISVTQEKRVFEVDTTGDITWEFFLSNLINSVGYSARARKYNLNYIDILIGDIYMDNFINIYDLIKTIDHKIDNQYSNKIDFNGDGQIDNNDIYGMIDLIFN
tara:strand:+ start:3101 stop:4522 length:1422 start_codon:yes stop_codon:yes gene_type:complete